MRSEGFRCPAHINIYGTGVYLAFPTSDVLKPTYRGHTTLVNVLHTKVGITRSSFFKRWSEYKRTFGGEVVLQPLIELASPDLAPFELCLLSEMDRRYARSGKAREWFHTADRDSIAELVVSMQCQLLRETGNGNA